MTKGELKEYWLIGKDNYACLDCFGCSDCSYCSDCSDCSFCSYCSDCYLCRNAKDLRFAILNVELGEEDWRAKMRELFG